MPVKLWERISDDAESSERSVPAVVREILVKHYKK